MATQDKDFKVKNGLQVGGPTNLVNYSSSSPSSPFIGQLWVDSSDDSPSGDLGSYLTIISAENTYIPISASTSFLTEIYADTLYDEIGSASAAEFNAKSYSDSLANNYDIAGSASAAQNAAQSYTDAEIASLVNSAPPVLDTLNELAFALGNDANFATSTASAIGDRLTIANASATYLTITEYNNNLPQNTFSSKSGNILLSSSDAQQLYYWATSGSVTVFDGHGFSTGERLDIVTNAGPVIVSASASQSIIQAEVTITAGKAATLLYVDTNTWSLIGGTE